MTTLILAAAAVIGTAFLVLAVLKPRLALLALVVLDISNLNGVIARNAGISLYKPELGLAVLVLVVVWWRRRVRPPWSPVLLGVAALYAGFLASLLVTADPAASTELLGTRANDLIFFLVVFLLVVTTDSIRQVAAGAVVVLAGLAGVTLVHEFVLHNQGDLYGLSSVPLVQEGGAFTPRHAGTSSDVNFWGRLLILVTPLALSLFAAARGRWRRLWWVGCGLSLIGGIYLTQSRGGFIALFVALVCWLALAGGWYRRALLFLPVVLAIVVPLSGIASRLGTVSTADLSVATRKRLQLDALAMFLDSPVLGQGINTYRSIFQQYDRLSGDYQPVTIVVAAHNFYLEQAADGGIVLLTGWGLFLGAICFCALRARGIALRIGDSTSAWLGLGLFAGMIGWLIASVFLHLSDFRAVLVIAVLAAALDARIRAALPLPARPAEPVKEPSPVRRAALVGVVAIGITGAFASLATGSTAYRGVATLGVVPSAARPDWTAAYQLDIVSRGLVVPTVAEVLNRSVSIVEVGRDAGRSVTPQESVGIEPSKLGGAVDIAVTAPTPADAQALAAGAITVARQRLASLTPVYDLSGDQIDITSVPPTRRWIALPSGLLVLTGGIGLLQWQRQRRRSRLAPAEQAAA